MPAADITGVFFICTAYFKRSTCQYVYDVHNVQNKEEVTVQKQFDRYGLWLFYWQHHDMDSESFENPFE